jgi:hypothetical protein
VKQWSLEADEKQALQAQPQHFASPGRNQNILLLFARLRIAAARKSFHAENFSE